MRSRAAVLRPGSPHLPRASGATASAGDPERKRKSDALLSAGVEGPSSIPSLGLYIHVPFCETKCSYCSFNSIPSEGERHEAFTRALCREIRSGGTRSVPLVDTVFFGGGTPSLLAPEQLGRILETCRETFAGWEGPSGPDSRGSRPEVAPTAEPWPAARGGRGLPAPTFVQPLPAGGSRAGDHASEVTIECNPGTVDRATLAALRGAGFNRVSFGAQSFDDAELKAIDRIHTARDIGLGVEAARAAGFENVSLDLIFALPGQTMDRWRANLRAALALAPDHLSCYMLQFDPGTPMTAAMLRGALRSADDELQKEMLLATVDILSAAGRPPYEISNYAKPGFACRHNVAYWTGRPYLGFGPGAHSFLPAAPDPGGPGGAHDRRTWGTRWAVIAGVEEYIRRAEAGADTTGMREELTRAQRMFEAIFLGLRMTRGVDLAAFERELGEPFAARHGRIAERLIAQGLIEAAEGHLRLTRRGLPVADGVMAEFGG